MSLDIMQSSGFLAMIIRAGQIRTSPDIGIQRDQLYITDYDAGYCSYDQCGYSVAISERGVAVIGIPGTLDSWSGEDYGKN